MIDIVHSLFSGVWSVFLIALFFGGTIFVHELGHFVTARRRGLYVERFSIGFGPAIWSWRGKDGVEYRIAWLPFGGYVLLPQLADLGAVEGKSEVDASTLPPVGYASKMIVFVAGVCCNVLFAFALACVLWVTGQPQSAEYASTRIGSIAAQLDLPNGSHVASPASQSGLRVGDVVRAVDGQAVRDWDDLQQALTESSGRGADGRPQTVLTIERDGRLLDLTLHPVVSGQDQVRRIGIAAAYELDVDAVAAGSPAAREGFRAGDVLVSLGGMPVRNISVYLDSLSAPGAKTIPAVVRRGGVALTLPFSIAAAARDDFGLSLSPPVHTVHIAPWTQCLTQVTSAFRLFASLFNPRSDVGLSTVSSMIAGPIGIVHYFHEAVESGLSTMLILTVVLNMSLAIINLFPLPLFDGGQMLLATIARIRGRALPLNLVATAQFVSIALVASFFVYQSYADIVHWVREAEADRPPPAAKP